MENKTSNDGNHLLSEIFQSDYSDIPAIGSEHWYRTIISNAKHCAEYINANPHHSYINSEYLIVIKKCFDDLIKANEIGIITTSKHVA